MIDFLRQLNGSIYADFLAISVRRRTQTANSSWLLSDLLTALPLAAPDHRPDSARPSCLSARDHETRPRAGRLFLDQLLKTIE
jgi:hypothetical protein